jgi:hypothetical protein
MIRNFENNLRLSLAGVIELFGYKLPESDVRIKKASIEVLRPFSKIGIQLLGPGDFF